jgi:hypothetical protein
VKGSRRVMQYSLPARPCIVVQLGIIRTLVAPSNSWRLCSGITLSQAKSRWARHGPGWASSRRCSNRRSGISGGLTRYSNSGLEPLRRSQPVKAVQNVASRSKSWAGISRHIWSTRLQAMRGEGDGEPPRRERRCKTRTLRGRRTQEAAAVSRRGTQPAPSLSLHRPRGCRGGNRRSRRWFAAPARTRRPFQGPGWRTPRMSPW